MVIVLVVAIWSGRSAYRRSGSIAATDSGLFERVFVVCVKFVPAFIGTWEIIRYFSA